MNREEPQPDDDNPGVNEYHTYTCAFCGEENEVWVDVSGGSHQEFTEDCEICCRPNRLTINVDRDGAVFVDVDQEYEA